MTRVFIRQNRHVLWEHLELTALRPVIVKYPDVTRTMETVLQTDVRRDGQGSRAIKVNCDVMEIYLFL